MKCSLATRSSKTQLKSSSKKLTQELRRANFKTTSSGQCSPAWKVLHFGHHKAASLCHAPSSIDFTITILMLSFNSLNAWMDNKRLKFQKMPTSFVAVQKISVWNSLKSPIYSLKEVLRNSYFKRIFKKGTFGCKDKSVLNLYLCHVLLFKKLNESLKHKS